MITNVEILDRGLDPAKAELWIQVQVARRSATTEVRGRLVGPRCQGATTVEVAYPLRPLPRTQEEAENTLTRQVIIPEPSFWDTENPFFYEVIVELK